MSKKLISFIGTNNYVPCNYYYQDKNNKIDNVKYIQEALLEIHCKDWTQDDSVIILATEKATERNWLDFNGEVGLQNRLKIATENMELDYKKIDILDGHSPDEIWDIFETIINVIKEGDEIIFDITHSFRSLPMLVMVLLNYTKTLKNTKVLGIYYGAFEKLGTAYEVREMSIEDRDAPIFDFRSFVDVQDWTFAMHNFLKKGDVTDLVSQIDKEYCPLAFEAKGKDETVTKIKEFKNYLNTIFESINTCRGLEIIEKNKYNEFHNIIDDLIESKSLIKPLTPLFSKVKEKISKFENENINNGFHAVEWCIENNMIQQGITILNENIITYILDKGNMKIKVTDNRNVVSSVLSYILPKNHENNESQWKNEAGRNINFTKKIIAIPETKALSSIFNRLKDFRNDINHAGMSDKATSSKNMFNALKESYQKTKDIIGF